MIVPPCSVHLGTSMLLQLLLTIAIKYSNQSKQNCKICRREIYKLIRSRILRSLKGLYSGLVNNVVKLKLFFLQVKKKNRSCLEFGCKTKRPCQKKKLNLFFTQHYQLLWLEKISPLSFRCMVILPGPSSLYTQ